MFVKLIAHTSEPDNLCSRIAQVCYSDKTYKDIKPNLETLRRVIRSGHLSTVEHATFTFFIGGISRVASHQLVRHRVASYSQQSLRYVGLDDVDCAIPDSIAELLEQDSCVSSVFDSFTVAQSKLKSLLEDNNIPDEDMRYLYPCGVKSNIVVTMNARELLHFFSLRCCSRSQQEIRNLANEMLSQCKEVAPIIFENAGAGCVRGKCPEGSKSCGKMNKKMTAEEFFDELPKMIGKEIRL